MTPPGDPRPPGFWALVASAACYATWLAAAFALAAYLSADRYPSQLILWTFALIAAGLILPLGALGVAAGRLRAFADSGPLAAAFCVVFAAGLSLEITPKLSNPALLGATRVLLIAGSAATALWSVRRSRLSRLALGHALVIQCLVWIVCGFLRAPGASPTLAAAATLIPGLAALLLLLPGLPRFGAAAASERLVTLAAGAVLVLLPFTSPDPRAVVRAAPGKKLPDAKRSVLLIVLDTLRRDHMSLHGYARKTTPAIDERAKRGLVFDGATSVASWTLPSHASMFTGLWPRAHGAHGFRPEESQPLDAYPLAQERVTLAEIARDAGYRTTGLTANPFYLSSVLGMDQGFQDYLCYRPRKAGLALRWARDLAWRWDHRTAQYQEMPYYTAPEMTQAAIAWLDANGAAPFFMFLNYMEAHLPNAAPGSQGLPFEEEAPVSETAKDRFHAGGALSPAQQRALVNEYDRELIFLDRWVGELLDYLERSGVAQRTLVILTSDHGESLGEHQLIGHSVDLHAEQVDVPLVVWEPGRSPGRVSRPVQSLDLFPTVLSYLGLPVPNGIQGQPLLEVDHPVVSELYYARERALFAEGGQRFDRILRTIRDGEYRYFKGSNGEERLFHLAADPGETLNLLARLPEQAQAGRARLDAWLASVAEAPPPTGSPQELSPETLEDLRSLGYIR